MPISLSALVNLALALILTWSVASLLPAHAQNNTVSGTITGTVRDKNSNVALPEVIVRVENADNRHVRATRTNNIGEYRLPFLFEGRYHITASKEGYCAETEPLKYFEVGFGKYNPVKHNLKKKKYHWLLDIKLSRPTLKGQVNNEDGRALAGVSVVVRSERWGITRAVLTDQGGGYQIPDLPTGNYSLDASWNGQSPESLTILLDREEVWAPAISIATVTNTIDDGKSWASSDRASRMQAQAAGQSYKIKIVGGGNINAVFDVRARATRRIQVQVTDEKDRPIPDVTIVFTLETDIGKFSPTSVTTDQEGIATVSLTAGDRGASSSFTATIQGTGFSLTGRIEVTPAIFDPVRSRQASEGEKAVLLVNTIDATRSANFDEWQIGSLPLGGASYLRTFDDLALLVAGVAPPPVTPGARGPGVGFGVGTAGQFSVNGLRARSNNFSIDGSDNNDADVGVRRQGFVTVVSQSVESVDALSVVTLLWDAELGRNVGGQINAVSKYGANQFHGQAYGFFTDSRMNARNFFDYKGSVAGAEDPFTRTQVGGIIGGPIIKNRTHLFASFERQKVNASTEQHFASPTEAERRLGFTDGDKFGALNSGAIQRFDKVTPLGANIFSFYPAPNQPSGPFGANTFTQILPADGAGLMTSFRLTQQFPERHTYNARYNFTGDERSLPSVNRAIKSSLLSRTKSHNLSLIVDSAVGLTRFNQARFSFGRTRLNFQGRPNSPLIFAKESRTTIDLPQSPIPFNFTSRTGPIGELVIEPFSPVGVGVFFFPQDRASNTFQYADTFWWRLDKHALKFGGNVRRYQLNSRMDRLYRPQVVYGGGVLVVGDGAVDGNGEFKFTPDQKALLTGAQLASLGVASAVLQTITVASPDSTVGLRFNEYHIFVNDNWRARTNLSLDYGLRYEYSSVPHSVDKRIERALTLEVLPSPGDSRFNTRDRTDKFNAAVDAYRRVLDGRNRIYDPDKNNFGPHVGLAWSPDKESRTALRAGYGIYYDAILGTVVTQSRNVFPREIPINADPAFLQFDVFTLNNPEFLKIIKDPQGNFTNPISLLRPGECNQFKRCNQVGGDSGDFVALIGQLFSQNATGGGLAFTLPERRLRTSYAQHWHLTLEREVFDDYFFSAAYVGTKATKLTRLLTPNFGSIVTPHVSLARAPSLDSTLAVVLNSEVGSGLFPRPNQSLGAYQIYENSAGSSYHALQIEARKRYNYGYQLTAAYTWSHAIDDVSDVFSIAGAPILPQNVRNLRLEHGNANYDLRHRFAASLIWDSPLYEAGRGTPGSLLGGWRLALIFQAQTGQPFTLNIPFDANLDGNLSDRPSNIDGLTFFDGHGSQRVKAMNPVGSYFDPMLNKDGVIGRNTVRGDGFVNLDLSLTKNFRLAEHHSLAFRAEFFNLYNRANFGLPIRTISAPGFGSAVDTVNPARTIQLSLKYNF